MQRLWWAGIPSALGTRSWEEQGEEGPSTGPRWVCEGLQTWGQLQRGINVNFSIRVFLQHPFEPAQCYVSRTDPILKYKLKAPLYMGDQFSCASSGQPEQECE